MGKKRNLERKKKNKEKSKLRKSLKQSLKKNGVIKLSNMPFKVTEEDVEDFFKDCGNLEYVILHRRKNGKYDGTGTVKFSELISAQKAVDKYSGMNMMGRTITVAWANKGPNAKGGAEPVTQNFSIKEEKCGEIESDVKSEKVKEEFGEDYKNEDSEGEHSEGPMLKNNQTSKFNSKIRVGRIIVRNLPFKVTKEEVVKQFESFGKIVEVNLLKRNGKFVGCGFVQFENKRTADKAITETNGKILHGRPIICDWALPKDKYMKIVEEENALEAKEECVNGVVIKQEPCSDSEAENDKSNIYYNSDVERVKDEDMSDEKKVKKEFCEDSGKSDEEDGSSDEEDDGGSNEDDDDDDGSDEEDDDDELNHSNSSDGDSERSSNKKGKFNEVKKPKVISNDVSEGRTIFVKNIPFSATNDDLRQCMKRFGPIKYALICVDELTEHSKGTGFVKFQNVEDAQKCLEANAELTIDGESIQVLPALPRDGIKSFHERKKESKNKSKDKRHLYLVKEGVILAGTHAANGVSVADMEKRSSLERWKTQMLRNLNMFVSNTRLVVYNVPVSWTDQDVFKLFKQHGGKGAKVTEARIMRDMRRFDEKGERKSKEYAFVRFAQQEHALNALRSVNNNPSIFSVHKRPIVSFSIENKAIHKVRENRLARSKMGIMKKQEMRNDSAEVSEKKPLQSSAKQQTKKDTFVRPKKNTNPVTQSYTGVISEPGNKNLYNKFLKKNIETHLESVKKRKQKQKMDQRIQKIQQSRQKKKEPMPKPRTKAKDDYEDSFSRLVKEYTAKLGSFEAQKKWYE